MAFTLRICKCPVDENILKDVFCICSDGVLDMKEDDDSDLVIDTQQ